jgi:hypothetical protein
MKIQSTTVMYEELQNWCEPHLLIHLFVCSQTLLSLLLPQSTKLKEQILEVLDADLIRQQAERGTLDFQVFFI